MRTAYVLALLSMVPIAVFADPEQWMKNDYPESLEYHPFAGPDCPFKEPAVVEVVEGEFVRARLKTRSIASSGPGIGALSLLGAELYLAVSVDCLEHHDGLWIYNVDVRFTVGNFRTAKLSHTNVDVTPTATPLHVRMYYPGDYGMFGVGRSNSVLNSVQRSVSRALTDYLKANFDALTGKANP